MEHGKGATAAAAAGGGGGRKRITPRFAVRLVRLLLAQATMGGEEGGQGSARPRGGGRGGGLNRVERFGTTITQATGAEQRQQTPRRLARPFLHVVCGFGSGGGAGGAGGSVHS